MITLGDVFISSLLLFFFAMTIIGIYLSVEHDKFVEAELAFYKKCFLEREAED